MRDLLLGVPPKDCDFVTTAGPEAVKRVALQNGWRVIPVGEAFGINVIVIDGRSYEVATARREWYGRDAHRPEGVQYISDIVADLSRRDFTINAMAMSVDGRIIDPFGGLQDLRSGVIRAVGDPVERFCEDALRPFRALRFAAQYGFTVEEKTLAAIPAVLHRVRDLSVERVRDEVEKILVAPHAAKGLSLLVETGLAGAACRYRENNSVRQVSVLPELAFLAGLEQNPLYHCYDALSHTLAVVEGVPAELPLRWAALLHDIAKGRPGVRCVNRHGMVADPGHDRVGAEMASDILRRLKVRTDVAARVVWLVRNHMTFPAPARPAVVRWLRRLSGDFKDIESLNGAVEQLLILHRADLLAGKRDPRLEDFERMTAVVRDVLQDVPFYITQLAITGGEVAGVLGPGPQVSRFLSGLLERVQAGQLRNERSELLDALLARERREKHRGKGGGK